MTSSNVAFLVGGIMVENEPKIEFEDQSIKFGRDVCFRILIREKVDPIHVKI